MTKEDFLLEVNHIIDSGHNDIRLGNFYDLLIKSIAKEYANNNGACIHDYMEINSCVKYLECRKCGYKII